MCIVLCVGDDDDVETVINNKFVDIHSGIYSEKQNSPCYCWPVSDDLMIGGIRDDDVNW